MHAMPAERLALPPAAPRRSRLAPSILLALLVLALIPFARPAGAQDDAAPAATPPAVPTIRVAESDGTVRVIAGGAGEGRPARTDQLLGVGDAIELGDDGTAVLVVRPTYGDLELDPQVMPGDALVLAPGTRVVLQALAPAPRPGTAALRPQVVAVLERGELRIRTGLGGFYPALAVRTADRLVRTDGGGGDGAVRHDPESGDGSVLMHEGMATISFGRRNIRVPDGLERPVVGGRVRGARGIEDGAWVALVDRLPLRGIAGADERIAAEVPLLEGEAAYVRFETTDGDIVLELDLENAPISSANFLQYVEDGFYAGTIFHRVVMQGIYVVQGGGLTRDLSRKPTRDPIENEWRNGLTNDARTISMARGRDANSATSQFFLNVRANPVLDQARDGAAYAVFGKVIAGWDVVTGIAGVPVEVRGGRANVPRRDIIIERAERIDRDDLRPPDGAG